MRTIPFSFGAFLTAMVLTGAATGCSNSKPTTPTMPTVGPTSAAVSDPSPVGEWNLVTPPGFPRDGCISAGDITGDSLDWTVQVTPGHPHHILIRTFSAREERGDCSPVVNGDVPRALQVIGHSNYVVGEDGTTTLRWSKEECIEDGGRYQINVTIERDVPSVQPSDREDASLIVNCGPAKRM